MGISSGFPCLAGFACTVFSFLFFFSFLNILHVSDVRDLRSSLSGPLTHPPPLPAPPSHAVQIPFPCKETARAISTSEPELLLSSQTHAHSAASLMPAFGCLSDDSTQCAPAKLSMQRPRVLFASVCGATTAHPLTPLGKREIRLHRRLFLSARIACF